jgi:hypothetical protein
MGFRTFIAATLNQITEAFIEGGFKFPQSDSRSVRKFIQLRLTMAKGDVVAKLPDLLGTWVAIEERPVKPRPGRLSKPKASIEEVEETRRQSLLKVKKTGKK